MKTRATGARAKHRGFSAHAAHRNSAAASTTATHACASVSRPDGSSRARVRGFRASSARSAMRLKPSATKRAQVNASTASPSARQVTAARSEEHTSELQSLAYLVCRLLLEKK